MELEWDDCLTDADITTAVKLTHLKQLSHEQVKPMTNIIDEFDDSDWFTDEQLTNILRTTAETKTTSLQMRDAHHEDLEENICHSS